MRKPAPAPKLPSLSQDLEPLELERLEPEESYAGAELDGLMLLDQAARGVTFRDATLRTVDLSGGRLEQLALMDVTLRGCNLANVQARGGHLSRVMLDGCRLTGTVLLEARLRDVVFRGCRIDLASFANTRLERVTFDDCVLTQTDFLDAELDAVRFQDCDLGEVDLRGARLRRCELRRVRLAGLQGIERLRGAAMEWPEVVEHAGLWAAALGIEVLD